MPARMKFWEQFEKTPTCWLWTGPKTPDGYGITTAKGVRNAHRLSWVLHRGPIPPGMQIDHLCRVRHCVNPDHMELVTLQENVRRGNAPTAIHARQTHCKYGHPFDEANTAIYYDRLGRKARKCRACRTRRNREWTLAHPGKRPRLEERDAA